jgi:hypothetical protein
MKTPCICGIIGSCIILLLAILPMSSYGLFSNTLITAILEPVIMLTFFVTFYKRLKK